jgi:hypothetical protein
MKPWQILYVCVSSTFIFNLLWFIISGWMLDWKETLWKKIDSEAMDMELKKFTKELRSKSNPFTFFFSLSLSLLLPPSLPKIFSLWKEAIIKYL